MNGSTADHQARLAVWQAYLQTHATITRLLENTLQAQAQLPLLWYNALQKLADAPYGALRLQDLAAAIDLSQSGLTRLVDRMVEEGLVERRPCPQDRRGLYAAITAAGQTRLAAARPIYLQVLDEHFLHYLTCAEVQALGKVFAHIAQMESQPAEFVI
jgi:DNA-binding MarR family transcriptional regulator